MILKIKTYYQKLNRKSQEIFENVVEKNCVLSTVHSTANDFHKLSTYVPDADEAEMMRVVCSQMESSFLALSFGLYRPALTTLRLAFEFGMGGIFFSSNKLAHREWINGVKDADLRWSIVNSPDNGVLSRRFACGFCPELVDVMEIYQERARVSYRCLSEYVHGNNETWKASGMVLSHNQKLESLYLSQLTEVAEILKFAFCCRYLRSLEKNHLEEINPILNDTFTHIAPIREIFGGPKDIK